jgi:hypothetical protein
MGSIALLLAIIVTAVIVAACVFLPGQNTASGLTPQQQDVARQILINDKSISNLSCIGEPELFDTGDNTSCTLAIVPVTIEGQYVKKAFIVDLGRNKTLAEVHCYGNNLSMDRLSSIVNLTMNAPIVNYDFMDKKTTRITFDVDGFEDTAPGYNNWTGSFISISMVVDKQGWGQVFHKIFVTIDDINSRVITVSDYYTGGDYSYSPMYVLLPPGQEKYIDLVERDVYYPNVSRYQLWTHVTLEPKDAKVYPLLFEGDYNKLKNNLSANALEYKDFMTGEIKRYNGTQAVGSGWSANISSENRSIVHMILKSGETNREVHAEINIAPNQEIVNILDNKSRNISNK